MSWTGWALVVAVVALVVVAGLDWRERFLIRRYLRQMERCGFCGGERAGVLNGRPWCGCRIVAVGGGGGGGSGA